MPIAARSVVLTVLASYNSAGEFSARGRILRLLLLIREEEEASPSPNPHLTGLVLVRTLCAWSQRCRTRPGPSAAGC